MYERFTDRARRVVALAQKEAGDCCSNEIRPIHLIIGMILEGEGVAALALAELHDNDAKDEIADIYRKRLYRAKIKSNPSPSDKTKKIFDNALRESLKLGHNYIGTEHLVLATAKEEMDFFFSYDEVSAVVMRLLDIQPKSTDPEFNVSLVRERLLESTRGVVYRMDHEFPYWLEIDEKIVANSRFPRDLCLELVEKTLN